MMQRRYHHGDLEQAVLALARVRLREAPNNPLSLRELARELGVSANAPYRHFPGKEGVATALVAAGYRELTLIAEAAAAAPRPPRALATGYTRFAELEPAFLRLVNAADLAGHPPESNAVLARDEWFAGLVAVVEAAAGNLPANEAYSRASRIWAAMLGVTQLTHHGARGLLLGELLPDAAQLVEQLALGR